MKNYSNTIICPVGKEFSTVKSHAHGALDGSQFDSEEEENYYLKTVNQAHKEVSKEVWVMWAFNARSAYVDGTTGSFGNHTLWRSQVPIAYTSIFGSSKPNAAGTEAPALHLNDGTLFPKVKGFIPFIPLPWILGSRFAPPSNAPPAHGVRNPFFSPSCYILNGKFYISGGNNRIEATQNAVTAYSEFSDGIYPITMTLLTTFYPTK